MDKYGINVVIKPSISQTPVSLGTELVFIGVASKSNQFINTPKKITSWEEYIDSYENEELEPGNTWDSLDVSADHAFNVAGIDHAWFININNDEKNIEDSTVTPTMMTEAVDALDDIHRNYGVIPTVVVLPNNNLRGNTAKNCLDAVVAKCKKIDEVYKAQVIYDNRIKETDIESGLRGNIKLKSTIEKDSVDGCAIACLGGTSSGATSKVPLSVVVACKRASQDVSNVGGLPYRTVGNMRISGTRYWAFTDSVKKITMSKSECDALAAAGFITVLNKGANKLYTWGDHTAAVSGDGDVDDELYRFDSNVAMIYHVANRFIAKWEGVIDNPMTLALRNDIINEEQTYLDYLVSVGALIGSPRCEFRATENTIDGLQKGQFRFTNVLTVTIPAKYIELGIIYTSEGVNSYIVE